MAAMELENKILKLEAQIATISRTLLELKEEFQENQMDEENIDIKKIEKYARQARFKGHFLQNIEKEIALKYLTMLVVPVYSLENQPEKKRKQLSFISRIYYSLFDQEDFLKDMIQEAKMTDLSDYELLGEELSMEFKECFLVDLYLLICIDGNIIDREQLDFFCEIYSFFCMKKDKLSVIIELGNAILIQDDEKIITLRSKIDSNLFKCYMLNAPKEKIIRGFYELEECSDKDIMIVGMHMEDEKEILDIDKFKREFIVFKDCSFRNIKGMTAQSTKTKFLNCTFKDCSYKNYVNEQQADNFFGSHVYGYFDNSIIMFSLRNTILERTVFENCIIAGYRTHSYIFSLNESVIKDCKFINCLVGVKDTHPTAAVIDCYNTKIENNQFIKCVSRAESTYGSYESYYMYIIQNENGIVVNNIFNECKCDYQYELHCSCYNYIVALIESREENNLFHHCDSYQSSSEYGKEKKIGTLKERRKY